LAYWCYWGGVLIVFALNQGFLGQARIFRPKMVMQYKSATEGEACVIDANCIEGLKCLNNICSQWNAPDYLPSSMTISAYPKRNVDLYIDINFSVSLSPAPPAGYDFSAWSGKWYFTCDHEDPEKQRSVNGSDVIANQIYPYQNCEGSIDKLSYPPCVHRIRYELYYNGVPVKSAETNVGILSQAYNLSCGG
jgi:hypothetical protein